MSASVHALPIWKRDSTPGEWLAELSAMALEHPDRFARIVVCYESEIDESTRSNMTRWQTYGISSNTETLGVIETTKQEVFEYMKGRRT